VVGTGGKTHYGFRTIRANSRVRNRGIFTDTGHGTCY
jgi:hypothetical protein